LSGKTKLEREKEKQRGKQFTVHLPVKVKVFDTLQILLEDFSKGLI
jgi:hypothetical protein